MTSLIAITNGVRITWKILFPTSLYSLNFWVNNMITRILAADHVTKTLKSLWLSVYEFWAMHYPSPEKVTDEIKQIHIIINIYFASCVFIINRRLKDLVRWLIVSGQIQQHKYLITYPFILSSYYGTCFSISFSLIF